MSTTFKDILSDFRFMLLEVRKQIIKTQRVLEFPGQEDLAENIQDKDDHIDNLKSSIEFKTFNFLNKNLAKNQDEADQAKAMNSISSNLERIGDFLSNVTSQTQYLKNPNFVKENHFHFELIELCKEGLSEVEEGVLKKNISIALHICKIENDIDKVFAKEFKRIQEMLKSNNNTEDLVTSLFILKYFERLGDSLLNIGENIINMVVGEKLKVQQYLTLEETLEDTDFELNSSQTQINPILNTWSGCRITKLKNKKATGDEFDEIIFKFGKLKKIKAEKDALLDWNSFMPGIPPKVITYQAYGTKGSLLIECLKGHNFKEIFTKKDFWPFFEDALDGLKETLLMTWGKSLKSENIKTEFVSQIKKRLQDVYSTHSRFASPSYHIGKKQNDSFDDLLNKVLRLEEKLYSPFSVKIHGDMNVDNIFFNPKTKKINFIDLHRTAQTDYIQDASVFLISNFRVNDVDAQTRGILNKVNLDFFGFIRKFARDNEDTTFQARMALGLIRSFATSTRFQLDENFAKMMYLRSIYLLEKIVDFNPDDIEKFKLPIDVIVI